MNSDIGTQLLMLARVSFVTVQNGIYHIKPRHSMRQRFTLSYNIHDVVFIVNRKNQLKFLVDQEGHDPPTVPL